ncbi:MULTISPECIES: hypothetical protein [Okeania]|uniref:hypothetical protein n=1 Tax=Okeania TaxID=1458928 RepID=UPI001374DFE4|nr:MULTISPECIES: hypothetical protein [Okeania]NET75084.1 hypothetical protein [Okeania sp. SIO1F9]
MVNSGGVRSQESGVRRREDYKDGPTYDDWRIFLCAINRIWYNIMFPLRGSYANG